MGGPLNLSPGADPIGHAINAYATLKGVDRADQAEARAQEESKRAGETHVKNMALHDEQLNATKQNIKLGAVNLESAERKSANEIFNSKMNYFKSQIESRNVDPESLKPEIIKTMQEHPYYKNFTDKDWMSQKSVAAQRTTRAMQSYAEILASGDEGNIREAEKAMLAEASNYYKDEIDSSRDGKHQYEFVKMEDVHPGQTPGKFYITAEWRDRNTGKTHMAPFTVTGDTSPTGVVKEFSAEDFYNHDLRMQDAMRNINAGLLSGGDANATQLAAKKGEAIAQREYNKELLSTIDPKALEGVFGEKTMGMLKIGQQTGMTVDAFINMLSKSQDREDQIAANKFAALLRSDDKRLQIESNAALKQAIIDSKRDKPEKDHAAVLQRDKEATAKRASEMLVLGKPPTNKDGSVTTEYSKALKAAKAAEEAYNNAIGIKTVSLPDDGVIKEYLTVPPPTATATPDSNKSPALMSGHTKGEKVEYSSPKTPAIPQAQQKKSKTAKDKMDEYQAEGKKEYEDKLKKLKPDARVMAQDRFGNKKATTAGWARDNGWGILSTN